MSKGEKVCVRDHRPRGDTVGRAPRMLKVQVNRWQRATRSMLPCFYSDSSDCRLFFIFQKKQYFFLYSQCFEANLYGSDSHNYHSALRRKLFFFWKTRLFCLGYLYFHDLSYSEKKMAGSRNHWLIRNNRNLLLWCDTSASVIFTAVFP